GWPAVSGGIPVLWRHRATPGCTAGTNASNPGFVRLLLIPMANPRKILIIQLKRAGDVLLTTPIAPLLKQHWPGAQIDFLVDRAFAPLLEHNPAIHTVQIYDKRHILKTWQRLREANYDLVFDFQSSPRSVMVIKASRAPEAAGYRVPFWGQFYR